MLHLKPTPVLEAAQVPGVGLVTSVADNNQFFADHT